MRILGIETSCDETASAVIEGTSNSTTVTLLSHVIASSLSLHAQTGGIIPEVAAREQIKYIIPVIEKALENAGLDCDDIDAIAVTVGPGLIGSLLVGVETAKTLSLSWNKPLIPVNHLIGHIYANWIANANLKAQSTKQYFLSNRQNAEIQFPALALIVSGGHTDLVLLKEHWRIHWLGGTRDDAAGEAFDKIARLLGLSYPGGPVIEKQAALGNAAEFYFPRPLLDSNDFDFSFSGLKTAVLRTVQAQKSLTPQTIADIAAGVQKAVIEVLVAKTIRAAKKYKVQSILLAGGVAANQRLREAMESSATGNVLPTKLYVPPKQLCTDNAAMIASAAFFNNKPFPWQKISANPQLYF